METKKLTISLLESGATGIEPVSKAWEALYKTLKAIDRAALGFPSDALNWKLEMETEAVSDCWDAVRPLTPSTEDKMRAVLWRGGFIGVTETGGLLIHPDLFVRTNFHLFW